MAFRTTLNQALAMLQCHGRVTYQTLQIQFQLDDAHLEALKGQLLYAYPQIVDDKGCGLIWSGQSTVPKPASPGEESESRFQALLRAVIGLLRSESRVTYRTLKYVFGLDDDLLEDIREELTLRQIAIDEADKILVWTGEGHPIVQPKLAISSPPTASPDDTQHDDPLLPLDLTPRESIGVLEPVHNIPEAERRQLTVMFCDLADSTKLSQQLDPEDLREVIRVYQESAEKIVHPYDGYIAQYLGDGLLIYFGWPKAHEDDAQRALHAGLGIVQCITANMNPYLERTKGVQLTVRIGIHTGPVVVGEMGGSGQQENLATGETVNIAARLEGLAAPNTIIVSSATERLVRGSFALEDLGSQRLKGVDETMGVFRVLAPLATHEDENNDIEVPFLVGRDEEVGLLLRRWEQSKAGSGQVVLIGGEAGIGKSSLVATIRAHVGHEGHKHMVFRCSPYHTNSALHPVIEHLQRVCRWQADDPPEVKLDKLEQTFTGYHAAMEEIIPSFAALLSLSLPKGRYPALRLTPLQQKQHTLDALVAWLMEEAERRPAMALWEDLHWADPSTLELLGLVLDQTPTVPMLNVLTYRPSFELPWANRTHMTPITLNRLERSHVEAVIVRLAHDKPLPLPVIEHIVTKTDGVPLYVEELTKMLLESDLLREEVDSYIQTGPLTAMAIPDTLQDSLMARLDQLNTAKELAQVGAVIGREFSYDLLRAILPQDDETLQAGLARLVEAELLYQRGRPPRSRYIFKHTLLQETAYTSLLRRTRQQLHKLIVQQLEAQFSDGVETQPELLAHHCTAAGLNTQAITYWQLAGERAVECSANAEAVAHLTQGVELLNTLPDDATRVQQELVLQTTLGPALIALKGQASVEVGRVYARARELCRQVGETPQIFPALRGLWRYYLNRAELQTAHEIAEQIYTFAGRVQDPVVLIEAHYALGMTLFWRGELMPAREHMEQGILLYDSHQKHFRLSQYGQNPGVICLCRVAVALCYLGYPQQALKRSQEALSLAKELSHPFSLVYALVFAAWLHQARREGHAALENAEAAMTLSAEHGFPAWVAHATILRGWALAEQGQAEEGIDLIQHGLADWQATGARLWLPYHLALLSEAHQTMGQIEEGHAALVNALNLTAKYQECLYGAELHRLQGELLLQQAADLEQAEICFHQALDTARLQRARWLELRAVVSLARLWLRQSKKAEARELLEAVYNGFNEGFDTTDLQQAKALIETLG